jgi:hypothetical protein
MVCNNNNCSNQTKCARQAEASTQSYESTANIAFKINDLKIKVNNFGRLMDRSSAFV